VDTATVVADTPTVDVVTLAVLEAMRAEALPAVMPVAVLADTPVEA
jgi:hypothetical protein